MTSVMKVGNEGLVLFPHFLRRNHRKIRRDLLVFSAWRTGVYGVEPRTPRVSKVNMVKMARCS